MAAQRKYFLNRRGYMLSSKIDMPDSGKVKAYSVLVPCFTCNKDLKPMANLGSALSKQGIAVFRFDFTGIGESEGNFTDMTYSLMVEDIIDAVEFMNEEWGEPELLIGHSLGGCLVIEAAGMIKETKAVATIGAPSEPYNISNKLSRVKVEARKKGIAQTEIGGIKFILRKEFFEDIESHKLKPYIEQLGKPLLVMHSPIDTYGPIEEGLKIFESAKQPKSFISLDNIDHLMLNRRDTEYIAGLISAWSNKYL